MPQSGSILPPNARVPVVDEDGLLTSAGLAVLKQMQLLINGLTPTIACTALFTTNVYTLTPFSISPLPGGPTSSTYYTDFVAFAFVAPDTSTGVISATVVPTSGALATLPVLKAFGATPAGAGDITSGLFYILFYVSNFNGGDGAFVLK